MTINYLRTKIQKKTDIGKRNGKKFPSPSQLFQIKIVYLHSG